MISNSNGRSPYKPTNGLLEIMDYPKADVWYIVRKMDQKFAQRTNDTRAQS
jgi:hypothetical protein